MSLQHGMKGGKHCGKRKCWLPAFSPFPTRFSKAVVLDVVKSRDCMVKCQTIVDDNSVLARIVDNVLEHLLEIGIFSYPHIV